MSDPVPSIIQGRVNIASEIASIFCSQGSQCHRRCHVGVVSIERFAKAVVDAARQLNRIASNRHQQ